MTTWERTSPLRLEPQLDGSATEAFDCGVAACVMALDDASYGLIRPSTEAVRKRLGGDRDATNPDQWKAAIDSFADRFRSFGLQPPRTSVVRGKGHDELWRLLHDQRRRVIAALHYGTVASEKRSLWASRSFRGNHAVYFRAATLVDEGRRVPAYDPLADGRFKGCPNGRRPWPFWLVRAATGNVRDGKGRRLYPAEDRWVGLVISKARPIGEPNDGVDPGDAGRLRTGEPAAIAPVVDPALWSTVQTMRERRRTRTPGRIVKGKYALRLCCAGCGKYLFGDVGRYRHPSPTCEGFLAAKPVVRCRRARNRDGIDTRIKGHSYPQEWYEDAVGELLGKVGSLDDQAMTEVVRLYSEGLAKPDELTLARIERERDEASKRLAKTRDIAAWQATMARLDAEQQVARQPRQHQRMAPDEVVAYLRSLPSLWNDAGPEGRQALASALFTKLEVEGYQKMRYELTPDAVDLGLGAALPAQLETGGHTGGFGRGERI